MIGSTKDIKAILKKIETGISTLNAGDETKSKLFKEIKDLKTEVRALGDVKNELTRLRSLEESMISTTKELIGVKALVKELQRVQDLRSLAMHSGAKIDSQLVKKHNYNMQFVDSVYEFELQNIGDVLSRVMSTTDNSFTSGERGGPADPMALTGGHFKTMLKRYMFAGKVFSEGKKVYDCCCGRGWGTIILSQYASEIFAVDYDRDLIAQCKEFWGNEKINWTFGSVLDETCLADEKFDVVTGMEIIEHFTQPDGRVLFKNISDRLNDNGAFVGTSYFPDTRRQADNHATLKRPDHHFLWTKDELRDELSKYFREVVIVDSWMVIATR